MGTLKRHYSGPSYSQGGKKPRFLKKVSRFIGFFRFLGFIGFLYKDRTRQYDPKAHEKEKHPIHGTPFPFSRITTYKTTASSIALTEYTRNSRPNIGD